MGHLSIEMRQDALKLLETEGSVKGLKVKKFRFIETRSDGADLFEDNAQTNAISATLGKVLSKERFPREPAGMAVGSSYCMFRDLDLPFKNDDQIRKVIKFEVEGSIQTDIDDVVISYFKKTESIDKSHLLVLGVKKPILLKQLELLQGRDVDPYFIDLDMLCIYNALSGSGILHEMETFFVINCMASATQVLALHQGRMTWVRSIPIGFNNMYRALQHDLKMARIPEPENLEEWLGITNLGDVKIPVVPEMETDEENPEKDFQQKKTASYGPQIKKLAEDRTSNFMVMLKRELLRTLTSMHLEEKPEKVLVTGAGCSVPGFMNLIRELFSVDAEELNLLSKVSHSFSEEEALIVNRELAVPLGIAYKTAGHNATRVNFRQEEVAYSKKFDQVKVPVACLVFLMLIFIVLLNLEQFMLRTAKRTEMDRITQIATAKLKNSLEDTALAESTANQYEWGKSRIDGITREIDKIKKELGNRLGREGTIPELPSVWHVWHQFFSAIDKHKNDFERFRLTKFKIQMMQKIPELTFDCELASGQDESNLERFLEEVPLFSKINRGQSRATSSGMREMKDVRVEIDVAKLEELR
ncbi:MAG: hypothetical protein ABIK28_00640 [Planctomycetota bacterium]